MDLVFYHMLADLDIRCITAPSGEYRVVGLPKIDLETVIDTVFVNCFKAEHQPLSGCCQQQNVIGKLEAV